MLFNSLEFIVFLFIILVGLYLIKRRQYQHLFLLIGSYFFYWYTSSDLLLLLILVTIVTYYCGNAAYYAENKPKKRIYLAIGTIIPLIILGYFKYFNFFLQSFEGLNGTTTPFLDIILPIGISFYTFQGLSYVFDLYRGTLTPATSFKEYALFVTFFPQLVAGPIVRASEFLPQLKNKIEITPGNLQLGISLILWGLMKKVLIADNISPLVNEVFSYPLGQTSFYIIAATILFGIQIYCDFSGYSDIAIGCAIAMGLQLPQNFLRPYLSRSPTEFWRRWHMTLGRYIKDYLYIPLGGNRKGHFRTYVNLITTMLICGMGLPGIL